MVTIGKASARSGVRIETIRYYERAGIVPKPGRSASGRRLYASGDIARLRAVRRCRELGFPIPAIRTVLSLAAQDGRSCGAVKTLAEAHLGDITARIDTLTRLRDTLLNLSGHCADGASACPILDTLMADGLDDGLFGTHGRDGRGRSA